VWRIKSISLIKLSTAFGIFVSVSLSQVQPRLTIQGVDGKVVVLSSADLLKLPQRTLVAIDHGTPTTFNGVLLTDVLAQVDPLTTEKFDTTASYYLLVESKDGYRALFPWAQLDSTFIDRAIYLVTNRDGNSLQEKDGTFQVMVPDEERGSRWLRQVTGLKIKQAE
jgi:hypothetical protein